MHHGRNHFIVEHISIIRYPIGCREEDGDSIRSSGSFPSGILMEKLFSLKGEGLDGETHIRIDDYGTTFVDKSYHDENILAEDVSVMPVELSVTVLLIHPGDSLSMFPSFRSDRTQPHFCIDKTLFYSRS